MTERKKFTWIAIGIGLFLMAILFFPLLFARLFPQTAPLLSTLLETHYGMVVISLLLACGGIALLVELFFSQVRLPLNQLTEEIALIGIVNPKHRLKGEERGLFSGLVHAINSVAMRMEALQRYEQEKVKRIRQTAERESSMLASVMAELPQGVLICNPRGRILLYNTRARQYFNPDTPSKDSMDPVAPPAGSYVGLGRSIENIIDRDLIQHALREMTARLGRQETDAASYFVTAGRDGEFLRTEMVPVLDDRKQFSGYILFFQDITLHMQVADQTGRFLKQFTQDMRASVAAIQTAIEAILSYPGMDIEKENRFQKIIQQECRSLKDLLDTVPTDTYFRNQSHWPLVRMEAHAFLVMVEKRLAEEFGLPIVMGKLCDGYHIRVDVYSLQMTFVFLVLQIRKETGPIDLKVRISRQNRFVAFEFCWKGRPVKLDLLRRWQRMRVEAKAGRLPFTVEQVLRRHGGDLGTGSEPGLQSASSLRFWLPACEQPVETGQRPLAVQTGSRPEYFDFNLFQDRGGRFEKRKQSLAGLSYTVFDTETTGLDPDGGDEILSIGAVRVVNRRILKEEIFDQLIDPRRSIPRTSTLIHGIQTEDLKGKPRINAVLPRFQLFVADTVLVAHNAAFDMRMLKVKETPTGVCFSNPILDTLLLSAALHPAQSDHSLEAIAERFGVPVVGRHSALGDALITAAIFVKMIPLLTDQGIVTLEQTLAACRKTLYARISY